MKADCCTAEFRGPGTHHRFDDSPDDYEMDMDQRTRFIGGRQGRIILLGDGTEIQVGNIHDDDGDVDMEDRGEAEEADDGDLEEQVQKDASSASANGETSREETPAPVSTSGSKTEAAEKVQEAKEQQKDDSGSGPSEPKMMAATDSADTKKLAEQKSSK